MSNTIKRVFQFLVVSFLITGTWSAFAYRALPLPKNIINMSSSVGQHLFLTSHHKQSFWYLFPYFTTETGLSWCAIASDVMVLNALKITPPLSPEHAPFRLFSQNNFFNKKTLSVITPAVVYQKGVTLEENSRLLKMFDVKVVTKHSDQVSISQFRKDIIRVTKSKDSIMLINYCRKYINQVGCGHFSPIAAYEKTSDRVLILDVARYKYPPVWVKVDYLYRAMYQGLDTTSHRHRGYMVVSK